MKKTSIPNTFMDGRMLYVKNWTPGITFFSEAERDGKRELDPKRSKLGAAIMLGSQNLGLKRGAIVLYLGASHGYTPSFVSDMVGPEGLVYCIEFSPTVTRDLVFIAEQRENMVPILADANQPQQYIGRVTQVDVVFQDIAQRAQVDIFLKNLAFLKPGGYGILALKARSVDTTARPNDVFNKVSDQLRKHVKVLDERRLEPFEKDHAFFVVQTK